VGPLSPQHGTADAGNGLRLWRVAANTDVNLLGDNTDTITKNTETLIDASMEVGLKINVEKTMYMLLSRHQNAGQNRDIKIAKTDILKMCHCSNIWERQ
jgi:hypothetical protein